MTQQDLVTTWGTGECISIELLSQSDVEQAWDEQLEACDRFEIAWMTGQSEDTIERCREEMQSATRHAEDVQELYNQQYEQRQTELAVA